MKQMFQFFHKLFGGVVGLPGSLLQLLELFVERLQFEMSVEVTQGLPGTINVFLTEGFLNSTDSDRESFTRCGIHIHTHEKFRNTEGGMIPSLPDIILSAWQWKGIVGPGYDVLFARKRKSTNSYMFDGETFWTFGPTDDLRDFLKGRHPLEQNKYLNLLEKNWEENLFLYKGSPTPQSFEQFQSNMENAGIKITRTEWKGRATIPIADSLECDYERRDKHLVLPATGLLRSEDLEALYEKALRIIFKRRVLTGRSFEAPFGGSQIESTFK